MKCNFFILLILTLYAIGAKGADATFTIKLNNDAPIQFCTDSALVAKDLTIEGTPSIKVMKSLLRKDLLQEKTSWSTREV